MPLASEYNISVFYANSAGIMQEFMQISFTFVSVWMYSKYKMACVLRLAILVLVFGACLRTLSIKIDKFWPIFFGQTLSSCCIPFLINVQIMIANRWFGDSERALATAI